MVQVIRLLLVAFVAGMFVGVASAKEPKKVPTPKPAVTYNMIVGDKNPQRIASDMEITYRPCDQRCKDTMKKQR